MAAYAWKPCLPVWQSRNIWIDKTYDKPTVQLNYILYMDSEEDTYDLKEYQ